MFDSSKPYTFDRVVRMALTAATLFLLFLLVRYLADVLVPFVAAAVLAYFLNPLVTLIESRIHNPNRRFIAVASTLSGVFLIGLTIVLVTLLLTMHQVGQFEKEWLRLRDGTVGWVAALKQPAGQPDAAATPASAPAGDAAEKSTLGVEEFWSGWDEFLAHPEQPISVRFDRLRTSVRDTAMGSLLDSTVKLLHDYDFSRLAQELGRRLIAGGATVLSMALDTFVAMTALIIVMLYLFFLLLDFPAYRRTWREFLPAEYREPVIGFLREFDAVLRQYFRGQFVIASILAVFYAVGFMIIGLPMAIPFGLFVGVLLMVPYLQLVAIVPAIVLAIMRSLSSDASLLGSFIAVGAIFVIAQALQDWVLSPRILGKATGLSPVSVMLGLFIWGKLLGFLGLLLAIPLTCLGITYYRRVVLKQNHRGSADAPPATADA